MVDGKKGNDDGSLVCILVVFLVITVASHLTLLESLCTVEHNIYDAYVSEDSSDPLTEGAVGGDTADKHTCPEGNLTEIVGAANDLVKTLGSNHIGARLLLRRLLIIRNSLKHKTEDGYSKADNGEHNILRCIIYSEESQRARFFL